MSQHNVKVEIVTILQDVPLADTPVSFRVALSGGTAPIPNVELGLIAPYVANFIVEAGSYSGYVQAVRFDGSLIGTALSFTAYAPADVPVPAPAPAPVTVQAPVPSSIIVTVTPA